MGSCCNDCNHKRFHKGCKPALALCRAMCPYIGPHYSKCALGTDSCAVSCTQCSLPLSLTLTPAAPFHLLSSCLCCCSHHHPLRPCCSYNGANHLFKPAVVAPAGAASTGDCLAQFAQIADTAWSLGSVTDMSTVPNADLTGTTVDARFGSCVSKCKSDDNCQFITFDYAALGLATQCYKRAPAPPSSPT